MKSVKKLNRIFYWLNIGSRLSNAKFGQQIQNHFSGKLRQSFKLPKNFLPILAFPLNLKSVTGQKRIFWVIEHCFKALECPICSTNTKPFFWESEANLKTLWKLSPYIGVSYRFAWKSPKSLNRTFWSMEYWFKALECQIWLMNTKPFFWKSETNLETLQNLFLHIGVSSEFVLKSVKGLNRIFWLTE